jgi:hypothetical protein
VIQVSINSLPTNIVGVPIARYQNFLRQLQSYETVLARYAAQRADHLSQAAELEREINKSEKWYDTTDFGEDIEGRDALTKEIRQMREQREVHLSEAARFDVEARSQISQIRETVASVMNVNLPLMTRIRNLFREQGVTIASVITAISFIISTIVVALTGRTPRKEAAPPAPAPAAAGSENKAVATAATAAKATPTPTTLYDEPELAVGGFGGAVNWLHAQLESLSGWLTGVTEKLANSKCPPAALLAWLLKYVNRLVSWLSEHTYSRPIKAE